MKIQFFHLYLLVGLTSALAQEPSYTKQLEKVRQTQIETDRMVLQLGAKWGVSPGLPGRNGSISLDSEEPKPILQVHSDLSLGRIAQGKFLFGRLVHRLVVGSEAAPAIVEIDPGQGGLSSLRVMGSARPGGTPGRVQIDFQRLLFRSGKSVATLAMALDKEGALGVPAQVLSGKAITIAGAMASSFIAGLAASKQAQIVSPFGSYQTPPATGRNAILQGVAQTAADQSKRLIEEATAEKPILILESGTPVTVFVQEEVRF